MAATIVGVFQPEMHKLITESRVLLVGTGGIGCEVLKNLVLMGFGDLHIIDLDTIEVSNLNRQFLFSKDSVGRPKSHVARESVLKFNPNVNIKAHLGDIISHSFGTTFFSQFKLVINALDNRKARSHVNRMCIAMDIPLIESGTMGYNGQVEFIKKGLSLCYECMPKSEPKSYPMCTIRNTPKEPIHCIIWAKYLFGQLFGIVEEDVAMDTSVSMSPTVGDTDSTIKTKVTAREWAKNNDYDPMMLFKKIFLYDIEYLLSMDAIREKNIIEPLDDSIIDHPRVEYSQEPDTKVLTLAQHFTMFLDSVENIRQKFKDSIGSLVWDKDNDDFMNFIVSSSNIRSEIFNIPYKSHFDIKSMAGNIVPAVATANAMVAGQIVIHALRILRNNFKRCQSVFLRELPNHKGGVLVKDKLIQKPNPNCTVCSSKGEVILYADCNKFTVKQLHDLVLKQRLNMVEPDLMIECGSLIISSDKDDELDLYDKTLINVGIIDYCKLIAEDYFQNYKITIVFRQKVQKKEEDPEFEISGKVVNTNINHSVNTPDKPADVPSVLLEEEDDCVIITVLKDNEMVDKDNSELNNTVSATPVDAAAATVNAQEVETSGEMVLATSEHEVSDDKMAEVISKEQEMSNEEVLAFKRKAEGDENISEPKKSRVDE